MHSAPFRQLLLSRSTYEGMLWHARAEQPLECCGLLAGIVRDDDIAEVLLRYPLVNAAAGPRDFESEPESLLAAWNHIRRQRWEVLAVYHSHPTSPPTPSRKDLSLNWSPDVVNFIVSLVESPPTVAAWWLTQEGYRAAEWRIE
jgi:proteasome lid subunit RPN8/RPN11